MTALEDFFAYRPLLLARAERLRLVGHNAIHVPAWTIAGEIEPSDGLARVFRSRGLERIEGEDLQLAIALGVHLPIEVAVVGGRVVLTWADVLTRAAELRAEGRW